MSGAKVVNLINIKMVPHWPIKKMSTFLIFLLICASSFLGLLLSVVYSIFVTLVAVFSHAAITLTLAGDLFWRVFPKGVSWNPSYFRFM